MTISLKQVSLWTNMHEQHGNHKSKTYNRFTRANDTIDQLDLLDICKTLHPKKAEYTFYSSVHGMFSRIDHILAHKASLNNLRG